MRRLGIVVLLSLWSLATAQERTGYVGFGVSYATYTGVVPNYPLPSLQIGGAISDTVDLARQ